MSLLPFVAVDVETANLNNANICQLGIAVFQDGVLAHKAATLINPQTKFNPRFERLHGITHAHIVGAPTWDQVHPRCQSYLLDQIVVSHTYFDREAIDKACAKYGLPFIEPVAWIDTCTLARCVWPEMRNHKLATLAECFGIQYSAHDACDDARCAGEIFLRAIADSGMSMEQIVREQTAVDVSRTAVTSPRLVALRNPRAPEFLLLNPQDDPISLGQILLWILFGIIGIIAAIAKANS